MREASNVSKAVAEGALPRRMANLGEQIQNRIHDAYYNWGHFVGRKPWTVITGSTFIALICMIRLVFPIETEVRSDCHPPRLRLTSRACVR